MRPGKTASLPSPPQLRGGSTLTASIVQIKPKQAYEKGAQY